MLNTALPFLHQFSYLGIFLLLAGGAIVLPIPEEITLLTAGYLVAMGVISPYLGIPIAVLGLLSGDALLFGFARVGSNYAHKLRTRIHKIGLEKTWIFSPKQPLRAVFILRFLTGLRFIAPVYAGFEEASWKGFLLVDTAAIVIFTTIMFALGFAFNASIIAFIYSSTCICRSRNAANFVSPDPSSRTKTQRTKIINKTGVQRQPVRGAYELRKKG
jgi:membrane-associated protein